MVEHKHNVPLKARITKYTTSTVRVMTAAIVATGLVGSSALAAPVSFLQDTFTGSTTTPNAWLYGGTKYVACLTAGNNTAGSVPACKDATDTSGNGALRLTNADLVGGQAGFVIYNQPFTTAGGIDIMFDSFQYAGAQSAGRTADGISFFLIDGSASPTGPGTPGYGLGYNNLQGGYVGVGLDHYGNFATNTTTLPGPNPDTIVLKGSQGANYPTISSVKSQRTLAGATRTDSQVRTHITIDTNNIMNVSVSYDGGATFVPTITNVNLTTINGQGSVPASFKLGFSASTGSASDIHEIRNLAVKSLITPIVAEDDTLTAGTSANLGNVFGNDLLGSSQPSASAATTTLLDDGGTGATLAADGTLTASKTLEPGTYTLVYEICETASPTNCSTATITLTVPAQIVVKPSTPAPSAPSAPNTGSALPLPLIATSSIALLLMLTAGMKLVRTYLPSRR